MRTAHNRIEVLHGPNFDVLELRDPEIYGGNSLKEIERLIRGWSDERGLNARSRAIADALELTRLPAVEVHISDVESREEWRRISVFDGLTLAKVSGKGLDGYREALDLLAGELGAGVQ